MNIKLVKLKKGGFHGAEVHFYIQETKGNRAYNTAVKKYPKDPIHKDLENLFLDLREHLLEICQMKTADETQMKFIALETSVVGVEFDTDGFILHGERSIFGNKSIKLNTPKVEESDEYPAFQEVMDIMRDIATETKLYIEGEKKVSDDELVERYLSAKRDKHMTLEAFNELPAEERREWATKLLEEEFGAVVMHASDSSVDDSVEDSIEIGGDDEIVIPVGKPGKKSKAEKEEEAF
jgi:hypothetical protein